MATKLDLSALDELEATQDPTVLRNLVERLVGELRAAQAEIQQLRDEVNRLKGEQGKPRLLRRPQRRVEWSSERERREPPKTWRKAAKLPEVRIDREEVCRLDPVGLPADARLKDYVTLTVQDVVLRTDHVRFRCERWYAPSTGQTYQAPLPVGYVGEFGPQLKALALDLYYARNVSQAQVRHLFTSVGVHISAGYLARLLTEQGAFAAEAQAVGEAGLASGPYAHLDVTPTRVAGVEQQCHVLGNPCFVYYHTDLFRDRQAALRTLQLGAPSAFQVNDYAWAFLATGARLAADTTAILADVPAEQVFSQASWTAWLDHHLPWLGPQQRQRIADAAAIGAYRAQTRVPPIETLVCDDAPTFKGLTADLQLCWVHEGRHYKKLTPVLTVHQQFLSDFRRDFWAYYRQLRAYQAAPTPEEAARLATEFATLFARQTGYDALDERIAKTRAKGPALLRVLDKPYLPLTNNPAELAARRRVRKRDVSFGARTPAGIRAWDVFHTLVGTAHLLGVNILHYFQDRLAAAGQLPPLADLIRQRAAPALSQTLPLAA